MKKANKLMIYIMITIVLFMVFPLQAAELYGDVINIEKLENDYKMIAEGNVQILYSDIKATGNTANYDTAKQYFKIQGEVIFTNPEYQITAEEMEGSLEQEKYTFSNNVKLTGTELLLTSREMEYNRNDEIVILEKQASMEYKDITAVADKITYQPAEEMALLEGNVSGQQNGYSFAGEKVNVDLSTEKVTLTGKAKLLFDNKGEE